MDLWKDKRVILTFLRHFGCRNCVQTVKALNDAYPVVEKHNVASPDAKVNIVAVGFGTMEDARAFLRMYPFKRRAVRRRIWDRSVVL